MTILYCLQLVPQITIALKNLKIQFISEAGPDTGNGYFVLYDETSILYGSGLHKKFLRVFIFPNLLMWMFIFPGLMLWRMRALHKRKRLNKRYKENMLSFGFLFNGYKP